MKVILVDTDEKGNEIKAEFGRFILLVFDDGNSGHSSIQNVTSYELAYAASFLQTYTIRNIAKDMIKDAINEDVMKL